MPRAQTKAFSMNIITLTEKDFIDRTHCTLSDERALHIVRTLKSTVGDTLRVGEINGLLGLATITAISGNIVNLRVALNDEPPAPLPLRLLMALPRPKMLGRILRDATSIGIKNIHIFHSERVEKSFWQTPSLAPDYVHKKLVEGLAQARDTTLPSVHTHRHFRDFIEQTLTEMLHTHTGVITDPFSPQTHVDNATQQPIALLIGPEGGFVDSERALLLAMGCQPLWLGSRILRVETAVFAAIGHLSHALVLP